MSYLHQQCAKPDTQPAELPPHLTQYRAKGNTACHPYPVYSRNYRRTAEDQWQGHRHICLPHRSLSDCRAWPAVHTSGPWSWSDRHTQSRWFCLCRSHRSNKAGTRTHLHTKRESSQLRLKVTRKYTGPPDKKNTHVKDYPCSSSSAFASLLVMLSKSESPLPRQSPLSSQRLGSSPTPSPRVGQG